VFFIAGITAYNVLPVDKEQVKYVHKKEKILSISTFEMYQKNATFSLTF
jgi:hypothetical protein